MTNLENNLVTIFQVISSNDITFIIHINVINSLDDSVHEGALSTTCGSDSHHNFLAMHYLTLFGILLNVPEPPDKS